MPITLSTNTACWLTLSTNTTIKVVALSSVTFLDNKMKRTLTTSTDDEETISIDNEELQNIDNLAQRSLQEAEDAVLASVLQKQEDELVQLHTRSRSRGVKSPAKTPPKSPPKSPSKSPVKSPPKSPPKSPSKSPAKSPPKSPPKSPSKSPQKVSQSLVYTVECPIPEREIFIKERRKKKVKEGRVSHRNIDAEDLNAVLQILSNLKIESAI